MFAGFNLNAENEKDLKTFNEYYKNNVSSKKNALNGLRAFGKMNYNLSSELEKYVIDGDALNGNALTDDWFPSVKADIFISHSHKDIELAKKLSDFFLAEFNLSCFIDSEVWKYAPDLLTKINDVYSEKQVTKDFGVLYNHEKSNLASQHVNLMLAAALHKMIDKTEMVILLDTPNSLTNVDNIYKSADTFSPWIYSEAICTQIVRHKELYMYRGGKECGYVRESLLHYDSDLKIKYSFTTSHMIPLTFDDLLRWAELWKKRNYRDSHKSFAEALDYLYISKKIIGNKN